MSGGFLGSAALDVAIGLAFVYLLLALMCTTVNEWIAGMWHRRARLLEKGIRQLLEGVTSGDSALIDTFYRHPIIRGLMRDGRHPSYMPARAFAAAVWDLTRGPESAERASAREGGGGSGIDAAVEKLTHLYGSPTDDPGVRIEAWFEDAMDRVSGWYKRETQIWTVLVALALAAGLNADTFKIVRHLWADPALRAGIIERVEQRAAEAAPQVQVDYKDPDDPMNPTVTRLDPNRVYDKDRELLGQLVGWGPEEAKDNKDRGVVAWLLRVVGWLLTAIAISLGAPFWFDVLNRFMNLRSSGKSPDETAKKPEKRKQPPADRTA